jgi:hypothetical protein
MRSSRTLASVLLRFTAALVLCLAAVPASAGIHYKADSTTTVDDKRPQTTRVEAWIDGSRAKIVFTESDQPMIGKNDYLLTQDGGQTVYLVDPEEETITEWDVAGMLSSLGGMMESLGGVMDMEFSDIEVEKLSEGPGGELLGRPVTRAEYRTSYTMSIKVFGMSRQNRVETTQELWLTDAFGDEALGLWLRSEPPATGMEDLDALIEAEMEKVDGFPLRSVAVSTTTGQKGKRQSTSRMETVVTELEEASIPEGTFELPAGYERRAMMEQ